MLSNRLTFAVGVVLVCVTSSCQPSRVVSVEALLQHPERFNHLRVTVAGCYVKGFERTVLGPCARQTSPANSVWVDSTEYALAEASVTSDAGSKPTLAIPVLSRQERARYLRLLKQPSGTITSVLVQGEFQTATSGGYGPGYKNRLILHRVLQIKANQ